MIKTIDITNYKSVDKLEFELGRVNVFIGENGCGKTNILEAIALAAASAAGKLDNEFLLNRGIRATEPVKMRSGFTGEAATQQIKIAVLGEEPTAFTAHLQHDNSAYDQWADMFMQETWRSLPPNELEAVTSLLSTNPDRGGPARPLAREPHRADRPARRGPL